MAIVLMMVMLVMTMMMIMAILQIGLPVGVLVQSMEILLLAPNTVPFLHWNIGQRGPQSASSSSRRGAIYVM
eukprot:9482519-Pyramimonas_sp.AAC.1